MTPFVEVHTLAGMVPMELWGGWGGVGFDSSLYLATGARTGGQASRVYRHDDRLGDTHWVQELATGTETLNKIRDGVDPGTGQPRLWVFNEGPQTGQSWLAYRSVGSPAWAYESIPFEGNAVGGRGLGVDGPQSALRIWAGGSPNWFSTQEGVLYQKIGATWTEMRRHTPSLMWEIEFEGPGGARWEFWNGFGVVEHHTYRNSVVMPDPPGHDISQAAWFPPSGHLYVIGELAGTSQRVSRFIGGNWATVLTMSQAARGDHVVYVPRGPGELWAVGHQPLQVYMSLNGTTWTDAGLPAIASGSDSNHLTALGFYLGRVWVAVRDAGAGLTRIYREVTVGTPTSGGASAFVI